MYKYYISVTVNGPGTLSLSLSMELPLSLTPSHPAITMKNAQSVFSSGNFSNQVPLVYPVRSSKNTPQSSASGSCDLHMSNLHMSNPRKPDTTLSNNASYSEAPPSSIDRFDGSAFPKNGPVRCLIPHLEALADLLQNPTSLDVAKGDFCESTIGCKSEEQGRVSKTIFNTETFRINVVKDVAAVELCGALKVGVVCSALKDMCCNRSLTHSGCVVMATWTIGWG